ncbi:hypothetical protein Tco_1251625 [Tanacetum coccineum]
MLNHSKAEPMGVRKDVLCQTFRAAKASLNTKESDSDDEEDYGIQRNSFGATIYGPKLAKYLNCNNMMDRALALQEVLNPFKKVYVWKKVIGNFSKKEEGDGQWHAEIRLTDPYGNVYDQVVEKTFSQKYAALLMKCAAIFERETNKISTGMHDDEAGSFSSHPKRARITENVEEGLMGHALHEFLMWGNYWNILNTIGYDNAIEDMLEVRVNEMGSDEFDKVVADDELMTKKAIKFRLCSKAYAKSILDFAKRLGLYTGDEIKEYGFETYIIRGLRNDDDFSADQYWINISSDETLTLSRSLAKTIRKHVLKVLQKLITYGLCQRTTGYDMWKKKKGVRTQRESLICCGQFVTRIAK